MLACLEMPHTIEYYEQNSDSFFESTVSLDTGSLSQQFLSRLPEKAHILDAGCGSGRDSLSFLNLGHTVSAFDACARLAQKAGKLTGIDVTTSLFLNYQSEYRFDGIWACASLLHVPYAELTKTFNYLSEKLKDNGVFYCSFKLGAGEVERDGRHFTNLNESELKKILKQTDLHITQIWITTDLRPDRENEHWLNAILKKA